MKKEEYLIIESSVNAAIAEYVKNYDRGKRKWLLANGEDMPQEQVLENQAAVRNLDTRKQLAKEAYLIVDEATPPIIKRMLTPLILRREFHAQITDKDDANLLYVKQSLVPDGSRFQFPEREQGAYRNKHQKGFWTCKGCMPHQGEMPPLANEDLAFYQDPIWIEYRKQVQWCPKFLAALVLTDNKTPKQYNALLMRASPDNNYCYAGLLHTEFQVTETDAKMIRFCDTCNYSTTEHKELAKPVDPNNFDVVVGLSTSTAGNLAAMVICKCKECGETVFEDPVNDVVVKNGEGQSDMSPKHQKILNDHYAKEHPGL